MKGEKNIVESKLGGTFKVERKAAGQGQDTNLYISGYAAVFNVTDSVNDIIRPGAFTEFLATPEAKRVTLCWNHQDVIGAVIALKEDEKGLYFEGKISNTMKGRDVAQLIEDGGVKECSLSFRATGYEYPDENSDLRILTKMNVFDVGPVDRAANAAAGITGTDRKDYKPTNENKMTEEEKKSLETAGAELKKAQDEKTRLENELKELKAAQDKLDAQKKAEEKAAGDKAAKDLQEKLDKADVEVKNLNESIELLKSKLEKAESKGADSVEKALEATILGEEFKNAIKDLKERKRDSACIEVKLDTSNITGSVLRSMQSTTIEAAAQNKLAFLPYFTVIPVPLDKSKIVWPEASFTGGADYVGENGENANANSAALTEKTRAVAKIGAVLHFTSEMSEDASYFLAWARSEAVMDVQNKVDSLLLSGNGDDSVNPTHVYGILAQGSTAFSATAAGLANAIPNANFIDLVSAVDAQIKIGSKDAYFADLIWMNPTDFAKYKNIKDNNGALLFQINGGVYTFLGKTIVQTAKVTAGSMIVADRMALRLFEKRGFELEIERKALTDSYDMYLRWRGQEVVPTNRKAGVIYIANIATALAAITGTGTDLVMGDLVLSALSATGATIGWASVGTGVQYQVSTDNVNWGAAQSALSIALTGLTASTSYKYYIKAVKSGVADSAAVSIAFTTPAA